VLLYTHANMCPLFTLQFCICILHFRRSIAFVSAFSPPPPLHWCRVFQSPVFHPCIFDGAVFSVFTFSVAPAGLASPLHARTAPAETPYDLTRSSLLTILLWQACSARSAATPVSLFTHWSKNEFRPIGATYYSDEREIWPNFTFIGAEMWEYRPQNRQNFEFCPQVCNRGLWSSLSNNCSSLTSDVTDWLEALGQIT